MLALVMGLLAVACTAADTLTVLEIEHSAKRFEEAGAATSVLVAEDAVIGDRCDSLSTSLRGMRSGSIREADTPVVATRLPSSTIPTFEVSLGFLPLITRAETSSAEGGVFVSATVAAALSLSIGDPFEVIGGRTRVAGIFEYPEDGRRRGLGYSVLVPVEDHDHFDECWASAWPQNPQVENLLRGSIDVSRVSTDSPPALEQLNQTLGVKFDGSRIFEERNTRYLFWACGIVAFSVAFALSRLRRVEYASNLHAGASHSALAGIAIVESTSWVTAVWVLSAASTAGIIRSVQDTLAYLSLAWQGPLAVTLGGVIGIVAAAALSSEHRLFRDFKRRE